MRRTLRFKKKRQIESPKKKTLEDEPIEVTTWKELFFYQYPRRRLSWDLINPRGFLSRLDKGDLIYSRDLNRTISSYNNVHFSSYPSHITSYLDYTNTRVQLRRSPYLTLPLSKVFNSGLHFVEVKMKWKEHYTAIGIVEEGFSNFSECMWLRVNQSVSWVSIGNAYADTKCLSDFFPPFHSRDVVGILIDCDFGQAFFYHTGRHVGTVQQIPTTKGVQIAVGIADGKVDLLPGRLPLDLPADLKRK